MEAILLFAIIRNIFESLVTRSTEVSCKVQFRWKQSELAALRIRFGERSFVVSFLCGHLLRMTDRTCRQHFSFYAWPYSSASAREVRYSIEKNILLGIIHLQYPSSYRCAFIDKSSQYQFNLMKNITVK